MESVTGLRSVLEDVETVDDKTDLHNSQGQESPDPGHIEPGATISCNPNKMLFGSNDKIAHVNTTSDINQFLLNVYHERVHALFKVLHWPSTLALLKASNNLGDIRVQALESAIHFTSVCSLFGHELEDRQAILSQCRQRAEKAFIEAGLLTTTSFTLVQAFVIYLVSTTTTHP